MSWSETDPMSERHRFIEAYLDGGYTMTELCDLHGISRKTGYKFVERFWTEGLAGLNDRSRAPHHSPQRIEEEIQMSLISARRAHPTWGPRKLLAWLERKHPKVNFPAASTIGDVLSREGLVKSRRRGNRRHVERRNVVAVNSPNELWNADFKGQFRLGDGTYCYPLTVSDTLSRYLLGCRALGSTSEPGARQQFERLFRKYGLPWAIRTDNGPPFSSPGLAGLSRLSVWWIKLEIEPVLIMPGRPEQNGAHERMHRTLKAETTRPVAKDALAQQRRFDRFRTEYNEDRPHESLGNVFPAERYRASERSYPNREPELAYPAHFEIRRVSVNGYIKWKDRPVFLSNALSGEHVGLHETEDGIWSIHFGRVLVARLDERKRGLLEW